MVFFDTAGEDLNSEEIMSSVNKYIIQANGIILLIDPLQFDSVKMVQNQIGLPNKNKGEWGYTPIEFALLIRQGKKNEFG